VQGHSVEVLANRAGVGPGHDGRIILRFESDAGVISVSVSPAVLQQLRQDIGQLLDPKRVARGWGVPSRGISADANYPQSSVIVDEILPDSAGNNQ
jgi:hypothetical protein